MQPQPQQHLQLGDQGDSTSTSTNSAGAETVGGSAGEFSILRNVESRPGRRRESLGRSPSEVRDRSLSVGSSQGNPADADGLCNCGLVTQRHRHHHSRTNSSTSSSGGAQCLTHPLRQQREGSVSVPRNSEGSRASIPGVSAGVFAQMKCGSLTLLVSSHVFSIICEYFGETEDYCSLCLVNKRVRDAARYYSDHILINILSRTKAPGIRRVRSVMVNNVGLWHYGRENFQDGLILFIPPPGAVEIDPRTHPIRDVYEDIVSDHLSLRNTYELDYDSNGTQQKFRFSTAWLPTPRSAYSYFENVRFLELMDFLNGLDWYLSFLDPVLMYAPRLDPRLGSPAPSTPNSTMSTFSVSESLLESFGPPTTTGSGLSPNQSTSLLSGSGPLNLNLSSGLYAQPYAPRRTPSSSLADLEEARFVNCRVSMEDVKVCVSTQYAAKRLVVVESNSTADTFSCDSSPRRRTRVLRTRPTSIIPPFGDLWGTTQEKFTQVVDLARCNTQQLEDLLAAGIHLRRVVVRCLVVVDQSSMETAYHSGLQSLSLTCAPDSTVRETSLELSGEHFPSLRECLLVGCPLTALGPVSHSLELLHLTHCQIDIRDDIRLPKAAVLIEGCRMYSPLTLSCLSLGTCQLSGSELRPSVSTMHEEYDDFTLQDGVQHSNSVNSLGLVTASGGSSSTVAGGGTQAPVPIAVPLALPGGVTVPAAVTSNTSSRASSVDDETLVFHDD